MLCHLLILEAFQQAPRVLLTIEFEVMLCLYDDDALIFHLLHDAGYDNGRAITSSDVVSLLTADQQRSSGRADTQTSPISLEWDPVWREHVVSYRERRGNAVHEHLATFPTLAFIKVRQT